jgi:hypothetical protein
VGSFEYVVELTNGPTGKPGLWIVALNIGMAWLLAEQAAKDAGRRLVENQHPVAYARENRQGWFFPYDH